MNSSNPCPVMSLLQLVWTTSPNSITNWGLNVQISEPTGDIHHENPHISKSLIRILPNMCSPCPRLNLISLVSVMKDPKSQVTFGNGGSIAWEIPNSSLPCHCWSWNKGIGVVQTVDGQGNLSQTLNTSLPGEREAASFELQFSYGKAFDTRAI